jgi:hypothetical protein
MLFDFNDILDLIEKKVAIWPHDRGYKMQQLILRMAY